MTVAWLNSPEDHDYPAAEDYLTLITDPVLAKDLVAHMKTLAARDSIVYKKAKDILRAARLPLLPEGNPHVTADLKKIGKGRALSPILAVRGDIRTGMPLQIADGYHRVCASFYTDENTEIPVVLAWRKV